MAVAHYVFFGLLAVWGPYSAWLFATPMLPVRLKTYRLSQQIINCLPKYGNPFGPGIVDMYCAGVLAIFWSLPGIAILFAVVARWDGGEARSAALIAMPVHWLGTWTVMLTQVRHDQAAKTPPS